MKDLKYLKEQLFYQIDMYQKNEVELEDLMDKLLIYDEIKKVFGYKDWNEFKKSLVFLDIKIKELYKENSDNILNALHALVLKIDKYAYKRNLKDKLDFELMNLNKLMQKILSDEKILSIQKESLLFDKKTKKKKVLEYRKIISNLENNYVITPNQLNILYEFMENYEFTDKEQILIIENIKNHNKKITIENYNKNETVITNILTQSLELEKIKEPIQELDNQAMSIYKLIIQEEIGNIQNYLPDLDTGLYNLRQYNYIYKKIMNIIIDEMKSCQDELSKKETYQDVDLKNMFIDEFVKSKTILDITRSIYEIKDVECEEKDNEEQIEELITLNNIYFSYAPGNDKSYIEKDVQKLPEEALGEVEKLLEKFKYGKIMRDESKRISNSIRPLLGYDELRGDQVRIVYKNICDNNYIFVGVGLKKRDNDLIFYRGCADRSTQIDQEHLLDKELIKAEETYQNIIQYIKENKRKGNRYGGGL